MGVLGFGLRVQGKGFGLWNLAFALSGVEFRNKGWGLGAQVAGFRVQGVGFGT